MIFLGQASNYSFKHAVAHLFCHGSKRDRRQLCAALAQRYSADDERIRLYQTGRSALAATFVALLPKGSSVIIPGLTCIAVVRAVRAAGCQPIFVDIKPDTLQYDFEKLEDVLAQHETISAILVQNTLGITIDIEKVEKLAKKYKIKIIEDLAHSAGRKYPDGREAGAVGAAAVLSFGKGKAIDTTLGGALIIRDQKARPVREPAFLPPATTRWRARWYPILGWIMRAGYHIGLGKIFTGIFLKFHWIERSADAELDLDRKLCNWQAKLALKQLGQLSTGQLREFKLVERRDKLLSELKDNGFYLDEIWYDTPVSPMCYKKEADFPTKDCPETVRIAEQIINLPTWYPESKLAKAREIIQKYEVQDVK